MYIFIIYIYIFLYIIIYFYIYIINIHETPYLAYHDLKWVPEPTFGNHYVTRFARRKSVKRHINCGRRPKVLRFDRLIADCPIGSKLEATPTNQK